MSSESGTVYRVKEAFAIPGPGGFMHLYAKGDLVNGESKLVKTHGALLEDALGQTVDPPQVSKADRKAAATLPQGQTVDQVTAPAPPSHAEQNAPARSRSEDEVNAANSGAAGDPEVSTELFDPSEHTVEEVNAYLDGEGVTPEERERVLQAERDGKARTTIVG